jgi:hypothetical protein
MVQFGIGLLAEIEYWPSAIKIAPLVAQEGFADEVGVTSAGATSIRLAKPPR